MRKKIIAGNWKMHLNAHQASVLVHRLQERIETHKDIEVVLSPSMLHLQPLSTQIDRRKFKLAAQNGHFVDEGAFTGEVSMSMLRDMVNYVIVGHSERRHIFSETDEVAAKKVAAAFRNGITPILCIGETSTDRSAQETDRVLHDQVTVGLKDITASEVSKLVVAYEPVWAIGTGKIAKPNQVRDAVVTIRHNIAELFGEKAASNVRVLYGGSVKADVASGYMNVEGIDGLLVGGASLNYAEFNGIVEQAHKRLVQG